MTRRIILIDDHNST